MMVQMSTSGGTSEKSKQNMANLGYFFSTNCDKVTALLVHPVHDGRILAGSSSVVVVDVLMFGVHTTPCLSWLFKLPCIVQATLH